MLNSDTNVTFFFNLRMNEELLGVPPVNVKFNAYFYTNIKLDNRRCVRAFVVNARDQLIEEKNYFFSLKLLK